MSNPVNPNKFILTTDFPTLKNDGRISVQTVIPGAIAIPSGGDATGYVDFTLGTIGAIARGRIASSKNGNVYYVAQALGMQRTGTVGGSPVPYTQMLFMWRPSATVIRFQLFIPNPYGATLTTEAGDDTINFYANTFLAPYS